MKKLALFLGRLFLGFGAAASVLAIIVTWSGTADFRMLCYDSEHFQFNGKWNKYVSHSDGMVPAELRPIQGSSVDPRAETRTKSVYPAEGMIVTLPGVPPFNLGKEIRAAIPGPKQRMDALVMTAGAFALFLCGIALVALSAGRLKGEKLPFVFGAAPLLGLVISYVNFYATCHHPWEFFNEDYFVALTPVSFVSEYRQAAVIAVAAAVTLSTITWAAQSFLTTDDN